MAVIALPPTGSIVTTSTSSSSVQNIIVYNASPTISAALAPTFVNSFLSANAPSGTGVSAHQITTVNYLSAGVAEISVAFWSTQTAGKSSLVNATGAVPYYAAAATPQVTILPSYPIVNVLLTSSGTMSTGQYALGFTTGNGQPQIPTVNAVYGSVFSLNTNQTGASIGAGALNASYASVAFSFIPSAYYAGVLSSATGALNTAGGTVTPIATTGGTGPLPSPGTSLLFTPAMTGTTAVAVPINPYISAVSSSTLGFQYPSLASATITQFPANSQFVAVPQVLAAAQISTYYPSNPSTKPVIQITAGCASTAQPIAVGQIVVGTGFSGSVTVSSVIQTNSSFNNGSGTAIIELALGSSAGAQSATGTGTAVFFINPTASLSPGVTLSGTGFNGTYQQLQYEAWCSYLYLDGAEREYFASTPMDMLITQINRVPINPLMTHEVNLAHPVKFLAFLSNSYTTAYATQGTSNYPPASSYQFKTQINGVDIGDSRSLFQWQDVPQYYHTPYGYKAVTGTAPVTLISYCLDTSKLQPTGTLNFSRLDSYRIVTPSGSTLAQIAGGTSGYIYAMNYNVLRIQKGMGGLLYSS
jgi:hypothetical protein